MSGTTANSAIDAAGRSGRPEATGRRYAAFPADAIGERCRADPAGIHIRAARHTVSPAGGFAQHRDRSDRRRRPGPPDDLRRRGAHRHHGPDLRRGGHLQPVPHHRHVFADEGIAADRAKSSRDRQRADRRVGQRLGRLRRENPAQ